MNGNPYSPPESVVADPDVGSARAARPRSVTFATGLLWLAVALRVLLIIMALLVANVAALSIAVVAPAFIVLAALALVTHNISRGRHWARIALLVIVALGVSEFLLNLEAMLEVFSAAVSVFIFALKILALFLVFTGDGAQWFRRVKDSS